MDKYPLYDVTTCYQEGERFHYGNFDYESIKPIFSGDELKVYDKEDYPDGNIKLLI